MPAPTKRKSNPDALGFDVPDASDSPEATPSAPADVAVESQAISTPSPVSAPSPLMEGFVGAIRKPKALAPAPSADELPETFSEVCNERTRLQNLGRRNTPEELERLKALDARFMEMQSGAPVHDTKPIEIQQEQEENLRKYHLRLRERLHEIARLHPHLAPEIQAYLNK